MIKFHARSSFTILSILPILLFLLLFGCSSEPQNFVDHWVEIAGRNTEPIYRIKVPNTWTIKTTPSDSLLDTTKALCEFTIVEEDKDSIRITLHNFPTYSMEESIPPMAQIARWKRQFDSLNSQDCNLIPQSYSGFVGYYFEGHGEMHGKKMSVLGWSLQIAPEHYRSLQYPSQTLSESCCMQMRADVTIKAVGSQSLMIKYKSIIIRFARSLELIEEIPTRL